MQVQIIRLLSVLCLLNLLCLSIGSYNRLAGRTQMDYFLKSGTYKNQNNNSTKQSYVEINQTTVNLQTEISTKNQARPQIADQFSYALVAVVPATTPRLLQLSSESSGLGIGNSSNPLNPNCLNMYGLLDSCTLCNQTYGLTYNSLTSRYQCDQCAINLPNCRLCRSISFCDTCIQDSVQIGQDCYDCNYTACRTCPNSMDDCDLCRELDQRCRTCSNSTGCTSCNATFAFSKAHGFCLPCRNVFSNCDYCNQTTSTRYQCYNCTAYARYVVQNRYNRYTQQIQTSYCQSCSNVTTGCIRCNSTGCTRCSSSNYPHTTSRECRSCSFYIYGCIQCTGAYECSKCSNNLPPSIRKTIRRSASGTMNYYNITFCSDCSESLFGVGCFDCYSLGCIQAFNNSFYINNTVSKSCLQYSPNCQTCSFTSNNFQCLSCSGLLVLSRTGTCFNCTVVFPHCTNCTGGTCVACESSYYLLHSYGPSNNNDSCQLCSNAISHCVECSSNTTCTMCISDIYRLDSGACVKSCSSYMPHCIDCTNRSVCTQCQDSSYLLVNNVCTIDCSALNNCVQCSNSTFCTRCVGQPFQLSNGACIINTECKSGYEQIDGICYRLIQDLNITVVLIGTTDSSFKILVTEDTQNLLPSENEAAQGAKVTLTGASNSFQVVAFKNDTVNGLQFDLPITDAMMNCSISIKLPAAIIKNKRLKVTFLQGTTSCFDPNLSETELQMLKGSAMAVGATAIVSTYAILFGSSLGLSFLLIRMINFWNFATLYYFVFLGEVPDIITNMMKIVLQTLGQSGSLLGIFGLAPPDYEVLPRIDERFELLGLSETLLGNGFEAMMQIFMIWFVLFLLNFIKKTIRFFNNSWAFTKKRYAILSGEVLGIILPVTISTFFSIMKMGSATFLDKINVTANILAFGMATLFCFGHMVIVSKTDDFEDCFQTKVEALWSQVYILLEQIPNFLLPILAIISNGPILLFLMLLVNCIKYWIFLRYNMSETRFQSFAVGFKSIGFIVFNLGFVLILSTNSLDVRKYSSFLVIITMLLLGFYELFIALGQTILDILQWLGKIIRKVFCVSSHAVKGLESTVDSPNMIIQKSPRKVPVQKFIQRPVNPPVIKRHKQPQANKKKGLHLIDVIKDSSDKKVYPSPEKNSSQTNASTETKTTRARNDYKSPKVNRSEDPTLNILKSSAVTAYAESVSPPIPPIPKTTNVSAEASQSEVIFRKRRKRHVGSSQ